MIDKDILEKLRCALCEGELQCNEKAEVHCSQCGKRVKLFNESLDFLPPQANAAIAGERAPASWRAWHEAEEALQRWRLRRAHNHAAHSRDSSRLDRFIAFGRPEGALLDIGSADGYLSRCLPPEVTSYFGLEPHPSPNASKRVIRGVMESIPFADGVFDTVVMASCFDYAVEKESALREVARVLRAGGQLLLLLTVHPQAVVAAKQARGLRSLRECARLEVLTTLGLRGTLSTLADGLWPRRRHHTDYFSQADIEALLKPHFVIEAKERAPDSVLFLRARKALS